MPVQIKTADSNDKANETVVNDAEAIAAAEMAAKAQQSQEEEVTPVPPKAIDGENPDDDESDWAEFITDEDDELLPEAAKAKPEEGIEETPIVVEEVPAKVEETPAVVEPETPPAEEVVAVEEIPDVEIPPVVAEETPQETRTPEEVTAAANEARSKAHEQLTSQYKMTEEQVEDFRENPGDALAKLAADMYLDTFDSIMSAVQQQVPQMIQQITAQNNQRQSADKAFFGAWPQLAKAEYRQTIDRIAQNYRAMNPKTANEEAIKEIGAQAWVALRLPLDQLMAHTTGTPQVVKAPAPTTVVHKPAGPGNAAKANLVAPVTELNEFEALAEEFIQDDLNER